MSIVLTRSLGVSVPIKLFREFKTACAEKGVTMTHVIVRMMTMWLAGEITINKEIL